MRDNQNKVLEDILTIISEFIKETIWITGLTLFLSIEYLIIFCRSSNIENCIINIGTSIPLFIVLSTVLIEVFKVLSIYLDAQRRKEKREVEELKANLEEYIAQSNSEERQQWLDFIAEIQRGMSPPEEEISEDEPLSEEPEK